MVLVLACLLACLLVNPCVRLLYACWRSLVCVCMLAPRLLLACLIASACLLCFTPYDCVPVHVHAQTQVELDRKAVLVFSGSAEHTASPSSIAKSIKASITTSMAMSTHGSSISLGLLGCGSRINVSSVTDLHGPCRTVGGLYRCYHSSARKSS